MGRKNGARPESNEDHFPGREAPGQPPSRARFFKQETTITATIAGFQKELQKLLIHVSFLQRSLFHVSFISEICV
jgi:hypothetical protein